MKRRSVPSPRASRSASACACVALAAATLWISGCGGQGESTSAPAREATDPVLRFCAIPDQDETRLREKFGPVAAYLSDALGVEVEYVHATSYSDSVELFRNGDVDLAWFGGLSGVQARHFVPGARAIAQGKEDPEFYSYFIANVASGLEPSDAFPEGLAGRRFAFGEPGSTSGRLMPEWFIRTNAGVPPEELFERVSFSGSHDRTAELVAAGQVDVGAINYKVYDRRVAEGQTDPNVVRVIWRSPTYPDYNFTAHPRLEVRFRAGFTDRLQAALIAMRDPDLLSAFPREALVPASNEDYASIRELALALEFIR